MVDVKWFARNINQMKWFLFLYVFLSSGAFILYLVDVIRKQVINSFGIHKERRNEL